MLLLQKPAIGQKPQISPKPRFPETIEMTLPPDLNPTIPQGLQTWPLKNRVITTENVKKTAQQQQPLLQQQQPHLQQQQPLLQQQQQPLLQQQQSLLQQQQSLLQQQQSLLQQQPLLQQQQPQHYNTLPLLKTNNSVVDEVAIEEKRLINALKNCDIINEESTSSSTSNTPMINNTQSQSKNKDLNDTNSTKWGLRNNYVRRSEQQVPHPELTTTQRQHLRQTAANPVRPFLTRGSVAERVLIFERCPDVILDKRVRVPAAQISKPQVNLSNKTSIT